MQPVSPRPHCQMFQSELPKHPGTPARGYLIVGWGHSWGRRHVRWAWPRCIVAALCPTSQAVAGRRHRRVDVAGSDLGAGDRDLARSNGYSPPEASNSVPLIEAVLHLEEADRATKGVEAESRIVGPRLLRPR